MPRWASFTQQQGTVLLTLLFMVVLLGLAAGLAGQTLQAYVQREREEELLWRGQQYRKAIASYVSVQGGVRVFPSSFEDLLRDPRFPGVVRHLRRLYDDPMAGRPWEAVKDPANRVVGVRSSSTLKPFRQDGFPKELENFRGKESYRDWEFSYAPPRANAGQPPPGGVFPPARLGSPSQ